MSTNKLKLKDWGLSDVLNWIIGIDKKFDPETTKKALAACKKHKIDGKALRTMEKKDFKAKFGISEVNAKEYARQVRKLLKKENKSDVSAKTRGTTNREKFDLNINSILNGQNQMLKDVDADMKVKEVLNLIMIDIFAVQKKGNSSYSDRFNALILYSSGKPMNRENRLRDYNIVDSKNTVSVISRTDGGSDNKNNNYESDSSSCSSDSDSSDGAPLKELNTKKYPHIKKTSKPDCITLEGDEAGMDRALMPCGHAICSETMYNYIQSIFCNKANVTVRCPALVGGARVDVVKKCGVEWDWQLCTQVANMTMKEYKKWTALRTKRLAIFNNEKLCPHCKTKCIKKKGVSIFRMHCTQCSNPDWCWQCCKVWNHSGLTLCGNSACTVVTSLNDDLRTCATIDKSNYAFLVGCPVMRACPRCLCRIYHEKNCKHMICFGCGKWFCWYCLALGASASDWPCGSSGTKCAQGMAQRQHFK